MPERCCLKKTGLPKFFLTIIININNKGLMTRNNNEADATSKSLLKTLYMTLHFCHHRINGLFYSDIINCMVFLCPRFNLNNFVPDFVNFFL